MLLYQPPMVGLPGMPFIFIYIYKEFELLIYMESPACVFMLTKLSDLFFDEFVFLISGTTVSIVRQK